ncbi:unnamed protein product [Lasius platythorax]|uniref:Uncharacterized protein n=1 Tax=Lasius platythorax TaxID=488582 RepID=A0AAV2N700_9HYME
MLKTPSCRAEGGTPSTIAFLNLDSARCTVDSSWIECYPIGSIGDRSVWSYRDSSPTRLGSGEHLLESGRVIVGVVEPA